jgi:uncharacterized membrane protein
MKTNLLFALAVAALLAPGLSRAQEPAPPAQPDREKLREELRNLPPEAREARLRQLREQLGGPEGGRPFQRGAMPGAMAARGAGIERIFMVLTPEQRESLRKAAAENRDQVRDLEEKTRDARKAVLDAAVARDFSEATLRQKLEAAAKLDVELTLLRAKALAKVDPPLSDDQIERIKNPPPMSEAMRDRMQPAPPPGDRPPRDPSLPAPPPPGPRDENDLPPRAQP